MNEHDHRKRAASFGNDVEAMHLLAVRVREPPRDVRVARGRSLAFGPQDLIAPVVQDHGLAMSLVVQVPDPPVRADPSPPHDAGIDLDRGEPGVAEVVAKQAVPSLEQVDQQKRRPVRPPVVDLHDSIEVQPEVGSLPGREVPDGGAILALPLVDDGQSLVAGDRRPAPRRQRHPLVDLFTDGGTRPGVDHPERPMDQVAVLSVFQAQESAVGGQPAQEEPAPLGAADLDRFGAAGHLFRGFPVGRHVHGEPDPVADRRGHDPGRLD